MNASPLSISRIGQRFSKLLITACAEKRLGVQYFVVQCDCGRITTMPYGSLAYGTSASCGKCIDSHRQPYFSLDLMAWVLPMTQEQSALISGADVHFVRQHKWFPSAGYASRRVSDANGNQALELLHRVIFGNLLNRPLTESEYVDHINRNRLDNRWDNLRLATRSQNSINRVKSTGCTGITGVTRHYEGFQARVGINGRRIVKTFKSIESATQFRQEVASIVHGEFAPRMAK